MYIDDKLVFLAGATGSAGSSILKHIVDNSPSVTVRAAYRHTEPFLKHQRVEYVCGDLRSQEDCRRMVSGCDCAVMAAASTAGSAVMVSEPWKQTNDNLFMNAQILEACCFEKVKRVVCTGSATLYQEFLGHIKETELDWNQDPFPAYFGIGWVTRFTEKLCQFWHANYGLEIAISRSANIYGPYSKFSPATSNFIPATIRKAVDRVDPFEVWGTPEVTRDVIFADDFARATVAMLNHDEIKFDVFNIGSGVRTKVGDVVKWALKSAGYSGANVKYDATKPTTIGFRGLDCSKANRVLGWQPQFTAEEGIQKTTEWWQENKGWWAK